MRKTTDKHACLMSSRDGVRTCLSAEGAGVSCVLGDLHLHASSDGGQGVESNRAHLFHLLTQRGTVTLSMDRVQSLGDMRGLVAYRAVLAGHTNFARAFRLCNIVRVDIEARNVETNHLEVLGERWADEAEYGGVEERVEAWDSYAVHSHDD